MDNVKWIEIARTGTFTDSAGREQTFTSGDLEAIAKSYDPQKRDCPLVFGHPQSDSAPAFGWAAQIKAENGKLLARFAHVPEQVKELVAKGHYRHVSMSLMPDKRTLRHVALLGAAQPAIDGLKAIELHDGEDSITVDFSTQQERKEMSDDELQRKLGQLEEQIKALKAENTTLKEQAQAHKAGKEKAEGEKKTAEDKAEKIAADFAAYRENVESDRREARVSALVKAGKVKPGEKASVLDFATRLAAQTDSVDFTAPDGSKKSISLEERYFLELEARPADERVLEFSTSSTHAEDTLCDYARMAAKM